MPVKKRISYLASLKFDQKLLNKWWAKYITQVRLVIMLILAIVIVGIFAYANIPRRLNPEINIAIVIVNTVLPGASPEDVEQLVTIPLEDAIEDVDGIDTLTSTSVEGNSTIVMQFQSGVDENKARDDVQSAVDTVTDLPEDALDPNAQKLDFEDEPIWTFAITTDNDTPSLMRFAKLLKDRIEDNQKVDRVVTSGLDEQDIEVIINPEKIREFGINPQQLSLAIKRAAGSFPAGSVETNTSSFSLSIDREIVTVDDIRNIRIASNGQSLRLSDVATVGFISKNNQNQAFLASPKTPALPTVQFFAYRSQNANIDEAEKEVKKIVNETVGMYKNQFQVTTITNYAQETSEQFNDLSREFGLTISLVFALLLVFLGIRQAVIASITVPLTFLATFAIMYVLGLTLNFLTMFAFLIALGVLIDDAIVVVAAMTRYFATGKFTPIQTGVLVWRDFIIVLWSTAITTIWAFVPLLIASGIIGEFIKSIPIVVTSAMLSSTAIAVFITIPLMVIFLKPQFPKRVKILLRLLGIFLLFAILFVVQPLSPFILLTVLVLSALLFVAYRRRDVLKRELSRFIKQNRYIKPIPSFTKRIADKGIIDIEALAQRYMIVIDRVLSSRHGKRNTLIAVLAFALLAYLLVPLGLVKNEFFPRQDSKILYVSVSLPPGTNLRTNKEELLYLLNEVRNTQEVDYVVAETGQGFSAGIGGRSGDASSLLLTLHLTDPKKRSIDSSEIAQNLRNEFKNYTKGKFTVQELSGGPPAGADVQITLLGDDLGALDNYANKTIQFLEKQPGTTNIDKSIKPGTSRFVFELDKDKLAANNLTVDQVSLWLRTYASGFTLDKIKFGSEEEDVVLRLTTTTQTPEDLGRLSVPNQGEQEQASLPLLSLGKITLATNPTIITRESGKRTITISAAALSGFNAQEINQKLTKFADTELKLPEGYSWQTGGINEENQQSVNSILQAMVLSFLLIFITMVIEFRSFRQTFIALMFIPISVAGVFYVFALTATPLSFPALIGVLALFGIVVRHAIVVIEKINENIREKMPLKEAIVDAAGNRLEPVLLTSLATIFGLVPITISDPLWRGLGGAIIAGLLFSGALKLFFVPVMYYLMYGGEKRRKT